MKPCFSDFSESLNIHQDGAVIFFQKIIAHWYPTRAILMGMPYGKLQKNMVEFVRTCTMHGRIFSMHYVGPTALVHCLDVVFTRHSFTI